MLMGALRESVRAVVSLEARKDFPIGVGVLPFKTPIEKGIKSAVLSGQLFDQDHKNPFCSQFVM